MTWILYKILFLLSGNFFRSFPDQISKVLLKFTFLLIRDFFRSFSIDFYRSSSKNHFAKSGISFSKNPTSSYFESSVVAQETVLNVIARTTLVSSFRAFFLQFSWRFRRSTSGDLSENFSTFPRQLLPENCLRTSPCISQKFFFLWKNFSKSLWEFS